MCRWSACGRARRTIQGKGAPDLLATAPISLFTRCSAKVLATQALITAVLLTISLSLATLPIWGALITFLGALIVAACAVLIQPWFRARANRTNFRRRQVASKASTFAERRVDLLRGGHGAYGGGACVGGAAGCAVGDCAGGGLGGRGGEVALERVVQEE